MAESDIIPFEGWAIIELMGHRRLAGYVREEPHFGTSMLRIDVPGPEGAPIATQFYGGGSIYCVTATTEEMARRVALSNQPEPVRQWELRTLPAPDRAESYDRDDDGDGDTDDEAF